VADVFDLCMFLDEKSKMDRSMTSCSKANVKPWDANK